MSGSITHRISVYSAIVCLSLTALFACAESQPKAPASGVSGTVPLFDNHGTLHHPITTTQPMAQRYFDQGLRLVYAFNHEEAIRSFEEAARIDSKAAMAYWGIALALGPNINAPTDREQERRAYEAIRQAKAYGTQVTQRERAYIDALAQRYSVAPGAARKALDAVYADAMRRHSKQEPEDADAATLFAEALMNLRPWDYWTRDGQPHPGTMEIVEVLEGVLQHKPDHIGACHYYIHTVEAWKPERALPCAERLPGLAPGAGHLVHMPSHIYIRVGRYDKAAEHNVHAVSADQHYLEGRKLSGIYPIGYYPHNIHFLWAALTLQGRSSEALKAARDLMKAVSMEAIRGAPQLESLTVTPLFALVRFGQWEDILREAAPPPDLPYTRGIWHYARGLAFTAKGQLDRAEEEHRKLQEVLQGLPPDRISGLNRVVDLLGIAAHVLAAQMAAARGLTDEASRHFEEAIRLQDELRYFEPPDWYYPVRESLGRLLLATGHAPEAEAVFREDLKRTPANPWSLYGLAQSLRVQQATEEGAKAEERFQKAWSQADLEFHPSRFEAFLATQAN